MIILDTEEYVKMRHEEAVKTIAKALSNSEVPYTFIKSSSLALHGLPVIPNDIDILTTARGAYDIEKIFSECLVRNTNYSSNDMFGSHFGELRINGVKIEVMGDLTANHGRWQSYNHSLRERDYITIDGYQIPVSQLTHERESYLALNRQKDVNKKILLEDKFSLRV